MHRTNRTDKEQVRQSNAVGKMFEFESRLKLGDLNVMVVDDNRHMRSLVREILYGLGVTNIRLTADAPEAFKEFRHFPADIIITDWHMEPLDGIELTKLVRTAKDSPNPFIPIIMLSAYTEHRRIVEARDAGINEFIAKPVSAKAIYQRIVSLINKPRCFIRTFEYFGPDRRRLDYGPPRGMTERRKADPDEAQFMSREKNNKDAKNLIPGENLKKK